VRGVSQVLRLKPRPHDGQHIVDWRIDIDADGGLREGEDAFGNSLLSLTAEGPLEALTIQVSGEIETQDTAGVISGPAERLPPEVYRRETPLTAPDAALKSFARDIAAARGDTLDQLHALLGAVHAEVVYDTRSTTVATSAVEAFAERRGVCQDVAHIFIACARHLGIPARYVSGHLARTDGVILQEASHAWAEALVPNLGWVGFDVANGDCPADRHVRVACGFDYLSAAPVRGARLGGGAERLVVRLAVAPSLQGQSMTLDDHQLSQAQS
jgi:transglutaminase-like putative cysteine protease